MSDYPLTLAGLSAPVAALARLMAEHPELPAPEIRISVIYSRLDLSFHPMPVLTPDVDPAISFEAWREAPGISPVEVEDAILRGGSPMLQREASTTYAGAEVCLIAYLPAGGAR